MKDFKTQRTEARRSTAYHAFSFILMLGKQKLLKMIMKTLKWNNELLSLSEAHGSEINAGSREAGLSEQ